MEIGIQNCKRAKGSGFIESINFEFYIVDEGFYTSYPDIIEYENTADYVKDNKEFIPFRDITEEIMKSWILSKYSTEKLTQIENFLLDNIDKHRNNPYELGLPWHQQTI